MADSTGSCSACYADLEYILVTDGTRKICVEAYDGCLLSGFVDNGATVAGNGKCTTCYPANNIKAPN